MNKTIFQFFHWYYSAEGNLWQHCKNESEKLSAMGVTDIWLPPAYKSAKGAEEPGYAVYDLYDLGEFDQKGSVRTKHGTKQEYLDCIKAIHEKGMAVLADIVLNHKLGADEQEQITVVKVKEENRLETISEPQLVEAYTRFTFPGRAGKYSDFVWDWHSFTGVCEDGTVALIQNEYTQNGGWEEVLGEQKGNFDYLMGSDIEFRNPAVREELKRWGEWYVENTGIDGFRLDGLKHITPNFFPEWLDHLNKHFNKSFFSIGEYWKNDAAALVAYADATSGRIQLFDVPLHFNFHEASKKGKDYDLRTIFDNTLVRQRPEITITFVDNHDTQPLQALESLVEAWFTPIAYAIILLREQGIPCVFYPAIYGAKYKEKAPDGQEVYIELNSMELVEKMMNVRKSLAYGPQQDYFDDAHVVGWTRQGTEEYKNSGCAVLISNENDAEKWMLIGQQHAGRKMVDLSGSIQETIEVNENGEGLFKVRAGTVSVWVFES